MAEKTTAEAVTALTRVVASFLNLVVLFVGLGGVWFTTHNGWAIFWACVAALRFSHEKK